MEAGCAFSFSGVNWLYLSQDLRVVRWYVWVALICWGPGCQCGSEQLSVAEWVCSGDGAGSGDPGLLLPLLLPVLRRFAACQILCRRNRSERWRGPVTQVPVL